MACQIRCGCGRQVDVEMWQAGTDVNCSCGQAVRVPSSIDLLGQRDEQGNLPERAQKNIEFRIMEMVKSGELPGEKCANCHSSTDGQIKLLCECSKAVVRVKGAPTNWSFIVSVFGILSLFFTGTGFLRIGSRTLEMEKGTRTETGTDVLIDTPLAMCEYCREEFASWRTGRTKRYLELMRSVPEYDELLQKYPQAVLHE